MPDVISDDEELPAFAEGPDPREWPVQAHNLWDLVVDLEFIGRALLVLNGPVGRDDVTAHAEAVAFLRTSAAQLRALLAAEIITVYALVPDTRKPDMFAGAGKARAFGAEAVPDAAT